MKRYRVAVCKGPDCSRGGNDAIFSAIKAAVAASGLQPRVEVVRGGCFGLCHLGPNVVCREDTGRPRDPLSRESFQLMGWEGEVHYAPMSAEKVEALVLALAADRIAKSLVCRGEDAEQV